MLCIRIDGQDMETTPASLAKLMLDGKVHRNSPATLAGATAEQPLEQALGSLHTEALTTELHRRLRRMGAIDSTAVDVQELCARVDDLCRWQWGNLPEAARLFWAAGWLHELADRRKRAVEFYDAFLLRPSGESLLRLLAWNNRGVLRLQLGRLDGAQDLARAAISHGGLKDMQDIAVPEAGLPTACFNLLNLINVAFGVPSLLRAIDEELARFFAGLPDDLAAWWLGPLDGTAEANRAQSMESGRDEAGAAKPPSAIRHSPFEGLLILRDPTYRRLNTLVARLSAGARGMAPGSRPPLAQASSVFRQLSLWDCRLDGERSGPPDPYWRYAEAASLLLSDDIPSALAPSEDLPARIEQDAREELAVLEGCLAAGQYERARSRLHLQRKMLLSLDPRGPLAAGFARIEEQLDAHQGQCFLQRALSALAVGPGSWDHVRADLAEALRYDPSSWRTVARLFGLNPPSGLWAAQLNGPAAAPGGPPFTIEQAGLLLGDALQRGAADARRCLRLWQCVEETLLPALAAPDAEGLAPARRLAETCLDCWPAGTPETPGRADPRHPVNRFLEACEKARRLVEAERLLEARPPRLEEAKQHLAGILQSGADTRDQLRRIVTGFYLAQGREKDTPAVQRQVLVDLEAWVKALPEEAVLRMRGREIVEETEKVRVAAAERSELRPCPARPDEPAASAGGRRLLAKNWGGRDPRPKRNETGNTRKEA